MPGLLDDLWDLIVHGRRGVRKVNFRKKPVVIEAVQWTGENKEETSNFINDFGIIKGNYVEIGTLEGLMVASINDWIIKGVKGEFYPCKPYIFIATYEEVK